MATVVHYGNCNIVFPLWRNKLFSSLRSNTQTTWCTRYKIVAKPSRITKAIISAHLQKWSLRPLCLRQRRETKKMNAWIYSRSRRRLRLRRLFNTRAVDGRGGGISKDEDDDDDRRPLSAGGWVFDEARDSGGESTSTSETLAWLSLRPTLWPSSEREIELNFDTATVSPSSESVSEPGACSGDVIKGVTHLASNPARRYAANFDAAGWQNFSISILLATMVICSRSRFATDITRWNSSQLPSREHAYRQCTSSLLHLPAKWARNSTSVAQSSWSCAAKSR
jgi:hypothetical protein